MRPVLATHLPDSLPVYREPVLPETEVRTRVLTWCSAWGSADGRFKVEALREIIAPGPIRMAADFGRDVEVSVSFEDYAAFWSSLLSQTFTEWMLVADAPIDVRVHNGMAAATFNTRFIGTTRTGRRMEQRQRVLQVWERIEGTWRLSHEQTTVDSDGACV